MKVLIGATIVMIIAILVFVVLIKEDCSSENYKKETLDLIKVSKDVNELIPSPAQQGGTGDKGEHHHDYLYYYKDIISRVKPDFKLLEIGVAGGYSVVSFCRAYPQSNIYGVDINLTSWSKNKDKFNLTLSENKRLHILKGNATKVGITQIIPKDFDIILDDGSHEKNDIIQSFELLFRNNLNDGGIYIIEDVHCNYNIEVLDYIKNLFPFVYKFNTFTECKMLSGRNSIKQRTTLDWRYQIKDITISRDIVIITKEK